MKIDPLAPLVLFGASLAAIGIVMVTSTTEPPQVPQKKAVEIVERSAVKSPPPPAPSEPTPQPLPAVAL